MGVAPTCVHACTLYATLLPLDGFSTATVLPEADTLHSPFT